MIRRISFVFLLVGGLLWGSGLSVSGQAELKVIAAHGILADVAQNVAGESAEVTSLLPVGANPHAFIPTPRDLTAVAQADLVLINGAGHEAALLAALANAGEAVTFIDVSACVEIILFAADGHDEDDHADEHDDDRGDEHDDEHADEHADEHDDDHGDEHEDEHADEHDDDHGEEGMSLDCDEYDEEVALLAGEEEHDEPGHGALGRGQDVDCSVEQAVDDHGHAHSACDPHVWMDPNNVIYWTLRIRDALSAADHVNEVAYAVNAAAYIQELVGLEADFILPALETLPPERRILVTSHETLGYLASAFGFEIVTRVVSSVGTEVDASARDVASLIEVVREAGVPAIFGDTFAAENLMQSIASEAGVTLLGLYSDTLSGPEEPAATYLDYMRYNVSTIIDGLAG